MRIHIKILLSVFLSSAIVFTILIAAISYYDYRNSFKEAKQYTLKIGNEYANIIEAKFPTQRSDTTESDIAIADINYLLKDVTPYAGGYAFVISKDAKIIAHENTSLINKTLRSIAPEIAKKINTTANLEKGEYISFTNLDTLGTKWQHFYFPLNATVTSKKGLLCLVAPTNEMLKGFKARQKINLLILIAGLLLLFVTATLLSYNISYPLKKIASLLDNEGVEHIHNLRQLSLKHKNEIGQIALSAESLIDRLDKTAYFATQIGNGDLNAQYELKNDNDILGKSLLEVQNKMNEARQKEAKTEEKNKRQNWITTGIAMFVTVLRHSDIIEQLSKNSTSALVKYMNVAQGAFFVVNSNDKKNVFIERTFVYGNSNNSSKNSEFTAKEGLIGRCYTEAKTIYKENIPDTDIEINSGIGSAKARSILIVPLVYNQEVHGIVELSAFETIPRYKIDFVEKVGESIAIEIQNTKNALKTNELLHESRRKSIELKKKELESREKNEVMIRSHKKLEAALDEIKQSKHQLEIQNQNVEKLQLNHSNKVKAIIEKQIERYKQNEMRLKNKITELEAKLNKYENNQD